MTRQPQARDQSGLVPILLVLTATTGIVDAVSYLGMGHVLVANMTGNVVFLGFALVGAAGFSIASLLAALAAFLVGATIGGRLGTTLGEHRRRWLVVAGTTQTALAAAAAIATATGVLSTAGTGRLGVIALLGVGMGTQNATVRRLAVPDLTTTVLTMTLTGLAADSILAGGANPRPGRRAASVAAMLAGGVAGGALMLHAGAAVSLGVFAAVLALATGALAIIRDRNHGRDDPDQNGNTKEITMSTEQSQPTTDDRTDPGATSVGIVGLGTMGSRLAGRLLDAGHDVHGTNRDPDRAGTLIARGLRWHETPRELAAAVDVVISMVTDDAALAAITAGPDGIIAGLAAGQVYIDMSSVSPAASVRTAELVRAVGADMIDAPVSGSVPQAQAGTLTIMVGGDETTFQRVAPLLHVLGVSITRVGDNGAGVTLKLAINISLAVQTLAFSEGLLLAERGGIDPRLAAAVMADSPIGSPMLTARVPLLLDLPESAWFPMRLMHKDIRLALDEARRLRVSLLSAAAADEVLTSAATLGYADRDIAGIREVLSRMSRSEATAAA